MHYNSKSVLYVWLLQEAGTYPSCFGQKEGYNMRTGNRTFTQFNFHIYLLWAIYINLLPIEAALGWAL